MKDEDEAEEAEPEDGMDIDGEDEGEQDEVKLAAKQATDLPEGFVEWEAVSRAIVRAA